MGCSLAMKMNESAVMPLVQRSTSHSTYMFNMPFTINNDFRRPYRSLFYTSVYSVNNNYNNCLSKMWHMLGRMHLTTRDNTKKKHKFIFII